MKSVEFCYWLQGLFELQNPKKLNAEQTDLIRRHLNMVFKHEIDPSYGDASVQNILNELHGAYTKPNPGDPPTLAWQNAKDELFRC
jgi:hypothetical protein